MRLRETIKVLLSSYTGKAGVGFFLLLVLVSLYVVISYPMDFGLRLWNNPAVWADNPKNAPPAWLNAFSDQKMVEHTIFTATQPNEVTPGTTFDNWLYTFDLNYDFDEPPTFTSFALHDITYHSRPPIITLSLKRPDDKEILLYRHVVLGPGPEESPPISRYVDSPHRVYLSGDDTVLYNVADFLKQELGWKCSCPSSREK